MSRLSFELDSALYHAADAELPVEVRRPDLTLERHVLSSQSIEVKPGTYYVSVRLPGGQELSDYVRVPRNKNTTANLTLAPSDRSPFEDLAVQHYLGVKQIPSLARETLSEIHPEVVAEESPRIGLGQEVAAEVSSAEEEMARAVFSEDPFRIRLFTGNVLTGNRPSQLDELEISTQADLGGGTVMNLSMPPTDSWPVLMQVVHKGALVWNVSLPISDQTGCLVVAYQSASGQPRWDIHLNNLTATALLNYMSQNRYGEVEVASTAIDAEDALRGKSKDALTAAVGAYALLRLGDLDRLHDWTANLQSWFPTFPDGAAIRGEHLARLGDHPAAARSFLKLAARGLPIFTEGITYALNRLRLYSSLTSLRENELSSRDEGFGKQEGPQLEALLKKLEQFRPFLDLGSPYTAFTGLNPSRPDARLFESRKSPPGTMSFS